MPKVTLDFAEKPALAGLQWRGVAWGSQRRLRCLKALQAAPLQVCNRKEVFQQYQKLRCDPIKSI
jgi:hypothetical protein